MVVVVSVTGALTCSAGTGSVTVVSATGTLTCSAGAGSAPLVSVGAGSVVGVVSGAGPVVPVTVSVGAGAAVVSVLVVSVGAESVPGAAVSCSWARTGAALRNRATEHTASKRTSARVALISGPPALTPLEGTRAPLW